jgi:hypothetical protein
VFEPTVVSLDRIIGVRLHVVPHLRYPLVEHAAIDRGGCRSANSATASAAS